MCINNISVFKLYKDEVIIKIIKAKGKVLINKKEVSKL